MPTDALSVSCAQLMRDLLAIAKFLLKLKMQQTQFSAGVLPWIPLESLRRSPRPPSRLGRGTTPLHFPLPRCLRRLDLAAFGASLLTPPLVLFGEFPHCRGLLRRKRYEDIRDVQPTSRFISETIHDMAKVTTEY